MHFFVGGGGEVGANKVSWVMRKLANYPLSSSLSFAGPQKKASSTRASRVARRGEWLERSKCKISWKCGRKTSKVTSRQLSPFRRPLRIERETCGDETKTVRSYGLATSSPGSSRFPIWRRKTRRPWGQAWRSSSPKMAMQTWTPRDFLLALQ